jgi:hypothetical protein
VDDMREIVTVEQINGLFLLLAIAGPVIGVVAGALIGSRRGTLKRGVAFGLAVGLLGPLNLALWRLYNSVTDRLGLDSVRNLLVNVAMFATFGIFVGLGIAYLRRSRNTA